MGDKNNEMEKLFGEWYKKHFNETDEEYYKYHPVIKGSEGYIPKNNFYRDGFINKTDGIKILFVAKECNLGPTTAKYEEHNFENEQFWLPAQLKEGKRTRFVSGLAMLGNAVMKENYESADKSYDCFSECAFINLNKRGGYNRCIWHTLEEYVEKYSELIKKQIKIIKPEKIICCGPSVMYLLKKYVKVEDERLIKAYHPGCYKSDLAKLYYLKNGEDSGESNKRQEKREPICRIFDTNCRYEPDAEKEMLDNEKAIAYGEAQRCIGRFRSGDMVLLYSSGKKGIIAAGKVAGIKECDESNASWLELEDFKKNPDKPVDMSKVNKIVYGKNSEKKINMRGTVKNRNLTAGQYEEIVKILMQSL